MADNSMLVKVGLFGAAGYLAYRYGLFSSFGLAPAATAPAPGSGSPIAGPPPAGSTPPAATPPASTSPAPSVLDGIFARIQSKAGAGASLGPDEWGWYLNNELAALGKGSAPDPVPLFGQRPFSPMSAAQWWGPMSSALQSQMGLNGLGIYGGLAAIARRHR